MKYNRAFIIRNGESIPLLEKYSSDEYSRYWLFKSGESFHCEVYDEYVYFRDVRIDDGLKLPLDCVNLEFDEDEDSLTWDIV